MGIKFGSTWKIYPKPNQLFSGFDWIFPKMLLPISCILSSLKNPSQNHRVTSHTNAEPTLLILHLTSFVLPVPVVFFRTTSLFHSVNGKQHVKMEKLMNTTGKWWRKSSLELTNKIYRWSLILLFTHSHNPIIEYLL